MHEPRHEVPAISQQTALAVAAAFAVAYVAPFYLYKSLRVSDSVCLLCSLVAANVHSVVGPVTPSEFLHRMGIFPVSLYDTARSMLLVSTLFSGPLFERGVVEGHWRSWLRPQVIKQDVYDDWFGWRAYVVGPVSEEFVFRSLNISLFLSASTRATQIIWQTPLLFGVAHLHHFNEHIITHRRRGQSYLSALATPHIVLPGLAMCFFQFGFTSLFGAFVTFVFLRTGNVYTCILQHAFCNWMGLPRVWGRVGRALGEEMARSSGQDAADASGLDAFGTSSQQEAPGQQVHQHGRDYVTWIYYMLLVGGAAAFARLLFPLTESEFQLVDT